MRNGVIISLEAGLGEYKDPHEVPISLWKKWFYLEGICTISSIFMHNCFRISRFDFLKSQFGDFIYDISFLFLVDSLFEKLGYNCYLVIVMNLLFFSKNLKSFSG